MVMINPALEILSFHDATLAGLSQTGDVVNLALDDVSDLESLIAVEVTVNGVRDILRNGSPVDHLWMEKDDGEVLTLREQDNEVVFVVQWNDFVTRDHETVVYSFPGAKIALHR